MRDASYPLDHTGPLTNKSLSSLWKYIDGHSSPTGIKPTSRTCLSQCCSHIAIKCFDKSHYRSSELPDVDVVRPCIFREFDTTRRSRKPRLNICLNGICQLYVVAGDATIEICPSGGFKCRWRIAEVLEERGFPVLILHLVSK